MHAIKGNGPRWLSKFRKPESANSSDMLNSDADVYTKEVQKYIRKAASRADEEPKSGKQDLEALNAQDKIETIVESHDEVPKDHPTSEKKASPHLKHFRRDYQTDSYTSKIQEYFRHKMR